MTISDLNVKKRHNNYSFVVILWTLSIMGDTKNNCWELPSISSPPPSHSFQDISPITVESKASFVCNEGSGTVMS